MSGVYVHIPFCGSKCYYCDFYSGPLKCDHGEYVNCLLKELDARIGLLGDEISTVYVGGGTPSKLQRKELARLLERLNRLRPEEFTVEVNPEDVDEELTSLLVDAGVNRVSMGVQSMDDEELKSIGRRHTALQATEAVEILRRGGVKNISLDLIYGLPGQSLQSWENSLERVLELNPKHLSAYSLSYEPGTLLWTRLQNGKIEPVGEETIEKMYGILCRRTGECGYRHYEISNFGKEGFFSRHNSAYWKFKPYLGIGAGAHSYVDGKRSYNPSNLKKYMTDCVGAQVEESLTWGNLMNEYVMVGLRTSDGIDLRDFTRRFGEKEGERIREEALRQSKAGNIEFENDRFRVPESRWMVSDSIIVAFFC